MSVNNKVKKVDENKVDNKPNDDKPNEPNKLDKSKPEPLLDPANDRAFLIPINDKFEPVWKMYKLQSSLIWFAHEIKLDNDKPHWNKLSDGERHCLSHILAFFAASDKLVACNLSSRFLEEITVPEVLTTYGFQLMMENIHWEVYSKIINTYINDKKTKFKLLNAIETIDTVKNKAKWAKKWTTSDSSFATRLVAFAIIEGIFFSGSFCAIYWMNERGLMPGLAKANDFIARDEGLHTDFACLLYNDYVANRLEESVFASIMEEAVKLETEFIVDALPCRLLGMNSRSMTSYIKYCANRLAKQLGHEEIYDKKEAVMCFEFMNRICLKEKSNFFEEDPSAYRRFDETETHDEDPYGDI